MKRCGISIYLLCLVCICLAACSVTRDKSIKTVGSSSGDAADSNDKKAVDISADDLIKKLLEVAKDLPKYDCVNSEAEDAADVFEYICEVEYAKIDSYAYMNSDTGSPEQIAVVKVKDVADIDSVKKALEAKKQDSIDMYKAYKPESAAFVEKGKIASADRYVALIVCANVDEVESTFNEVL